MINLNQGTLRNLIIQTPPLAEQHAIASALSDADALIAALDALIAKKRDLKQAAMQQLLTGKTRLPGFKGEWRETTLGECLRNRPRYGINAPAVLFSDRLPTYIRITDISDGGRFLQTEPASVSHPASLNYLLEEGDVVVARTGASVGKSYAYRKSDGILVFAGFLIQMKPNPRKLSSDYLSYMMNTQSYWNWVQLNSMRSGQPGINASEYQNLPIRVPATDEQSAIAAILLDMDAELAALEARRVKAIAIKQAMMQELLTGRIRLI